MRFSIPDHWVQTTMTESVLFILAGYPAVGKSTLLTHALKKKIPLFGKKYDPYFQQTRIPEKFPEWTNSSQQLLDQGTWFGGRDIPFLVKQPALPDQILIHLDIIHLVYAEDHLPNLPPELNALMPRPVDSFAIDQTNDSFMRHSLSNPFYKAFDHIVVNTLYSPWADIADQWHRRQITEQRKDRNKMALFDYNSPRQDIHKSVYDSWFREMQRLKPEIELKTRVEGSKIIISRIRESGSELN